MITENLEQRIKKLSTKELELVKLLIFHYNNFNTSDEMRTGYRFALHHVFQMLDIASVPDIDLRPIVEQQIEKLVKTITSIEKEISDKK